MKIEIRRYLGRVLAYSMNESKQQGGLKSSTAIKVKHANIENAESCVGRAWTFLLANHSLWKIMSDHLKRVNQVKTFWPFFSVNPLAYPRRNIGGPRR